MSAFVNYSNHDFNTWSEQQLAAARALGELEYRPFPDINPSWDAVQVKEFALETAKELMKDFPDKRQVVFHIQGEMTFLFALLQVLLQNGYRCLSSTTKRFDQRLPDGRIVKNFQFLDFRDYTLITPLNLAEEKNA